MAVEFSTKINLPDKVPPQNTEAEQCLLGCLMLDKDAILKVVDFIKTEDFYRGIHQEIFQAMADLYQRNEPIDILSVSTRLREKEKLDEIGGSSYLTSLINTVPTATHISNYAKIVRQKKILRDLISASHEIGLSAFDESEEVDILLDKAEKTVFNIGQRALTQTFTPIKDILPDTFNRLDELSKFQGNLRGIATGFKELDQKLAGLQKSDLIILAARPGMGKTSLALDIAKNVAIFENKPVGLFSLEMSKDQLAERLIANVGNVDSWHLRTGRLQNDDFSRIQHAMGTLSEAPIYVDDAGSVNMLQMRAMARRLQANKGLGLLIIDYLQLMQPMNRFASPVQQVTDNSRALKILAKELDVPVLVLSQLSRAVEQRVPQIPKLSDLRESGCLTGDTLITRADTGERIPIKNLVGKKDVPVHCLNENWQIEERKISKIFCTGKKMVYELKTRSGFSVKASANHPFWKVSGWTRLDELKTGDHIATPAKLKLSNPKNELSDDEIILLAHLLGDGCILPKQPYHLTNNKIHPITNWYMQLGLQRVRSYDKEIPHAIFSLDNQKLSLFLKHLWATDGNISVKYLNRRKPSGAIYYSTTSKKMAEQLKHLLLRFGIRSAISEKKKLDYRICYRILIQGKNNQLKFLRQINSYGQRGKIAEKIINYLDKIEPNTNLDVWPKETWQLIIDPVRQANNMTWREVCHEMNTSYGGSSLFKNGLGTERLSRIALCLKSPEIKKMSESEIFWDEIISIKELGVEKVYDATVPGLHNFVADGVIVHNSIEQDADVVMFIYREDKYNENSLQKNVAKILIEKHRNGPTGAVDLYFDEQRVSFRNLDKNEYSEGEIS